MSQHGVLDVAACEETEDLAEASMSQHTRVYAAACGRNQNKQNQVCCSMQGSMLQHAIIRKNSTNMLKGVRYGMHNLMPRHVMKSMTRHKQGHVEACEMKKLLPNIVCSSIQ